MAAENRALAMAFMVAATVFIAATTLLAKALGTETLGPPLHPLQISHGRFIFAWLAITSVVLALRPQLRATNLKLHLARTSCGWLGVTFMFAAVASIPLQDATALSFLNVVFCMLLAIPLLGERVGPVRWSAALIALVGAVVLLRPGTGALQMGAFLALGAALIMGLELIFIKRLAGREGPLTILFINNTIGVVISSIAVSFVWAPPTSMQWAALAGLGVLMACAQACFVNAMSRADASFITPFSYLTLVFAAFYDAALFGVLPDATSVLGASIIIAGAALLAWREARLKPSAGSQSGTSTSPKT